MARKTNKQRKAAIKPWRAKFRGTCPKCNGKIDKHRDLVCRHDDNVIHYQCHPDWYPAPLSPGDKTKAPRGA